MTTANPASVVTGEIRLLREQLAAEREKSKAWRTAYHSLRLSLEGRLDRIAELLEDTEWITDPRDPAERGTK